MSSRGSMKNLYVLLWTMPQDVDEMLMDNS